MGCTCCKMIQSYFFDPVQASSPGYVNEVSSCKLDEDDTVRLKDKQSSKVLVHKNDLQDEYLKRTESQSRTASFQELCRPHREPLPQRDPGGNHCMEKTGGAVNGVGPAAALQPTANPRPQHDDRDSLASTANNDVHPALPFLEGEGTRKQDYALPVSEETQVIQSGSSRAPSKAESHALDVQDHVLQIPAPDYPQLWDSAVDNVDHEEKDCLFQNHTEDEPPKQIFLHNLNMPCMLGSWDSFNEGMATEVLSVYFKEEDPALAEPVVDTRNGQEDVHASNGDRNGEMVDEDAAVAEALAALEAATAGEDIDEVY
ncbi:uncharacterized protein C4orf19 homolog [Trichechus manatus latirostris]|uniref:Uncharacterized protein C4orf19 homolog n=1 Tax=Trichechus manatus latirostris TaxID=127582 RepID=A0A2Y9E0D6_TRIMA|nr:uncharacterized protein C4orf19 homolog [Trichechus manatus latirostris]